jgi:uncharacterized iron-regulated protein
MLPFAERYRMTTVGFFDQRIPFLNMRPWILIPAWLTMVLVWGCAPIMEEVKKEYRPGEIIDGGTPRILSIFQLTDCLGKVPVVFVGEEHDNQQHHALQLEIISHLYQRGTSLSIGLEMFPRESQSILDRWIRGEMNEQAFQKEIEWDRVWGYPFNLYREILVFARDHGIRLAALNAPRELVNKVAKKGLAGLNPSERLRIAKDIKLDDQTQRQLIYQQFLKHPLVSYNFDYFYEAQRTWDETMAETLAKLFDNIQTAPHTVVVLAGINHMNRRLGIPEAFARRTGLTFAILIPATPDHLADLIREKAADYLWVN